MFDLLAPRQNGAGAIEPVLKGAERGAEDPEIVWGECWWWGVGEVKKAKDLVQFLIREMRCIKLNVDNVALL